MRDHGAGDAEVADVAGNEGHVCPGHADDRKVGNRLHKPDHPNGARDGQENTQDSRKRRHQPEPDGEHKVGGEIEDQRRPIGDASPLDDEGQIFFFVYDMIVAHNAPFLSDAAGTGLPAERLGPDHGDQHAAEQGEEEGPLAYPLESLFVGNHVQYQHDYAAGNAG